MAVLFRQFKNMGDKKLEEALVKSGIPYNIIRQVMTSFNKGPFNKGPLSLNKGPLHVPLHVPLQWNIHVFM